MSESSVAKPAAAFFDVDGTLVKSTIVNYYVYFRRRRMSVWASRLWLAAYVPKCLYYLWVDRRDRIRFNVLFYHDYAGLPAEETQALAAECHRDVIRPRLFAEGAACVAEHRKFGRRPVLVTGSVDFIMHPLASELGIRDVVATKLVEQDGRFTGSLDGPPLSGAEKARRIVDFSKQEGIDLSASHAYGDSIADLEMLEAVGFPHAVNPGKALAALAAARGWPVHRWSL